MKFNYGSNGDEWNFALMYYKSLNDIRDAKSKAYIAGDMFVYRDCLEEIFIAISIKLTRAEEAKLKEQFARGNVMLANRDERSKAFYRRIDLALMFLMNKYNMIFPGGNSNGGLKGIRARYGVDKVGEVEIKE